ncbi:hypothetical protein G7Y89_g12545 [Cudoniella acicularis]|uniref:Alanine racemase N-terminal domain-containing protein n=1 Tax=Cudoniella acicularis TaxID=354080 RepID=A0A8H4VZ25_9HELO|nr:hypothetical protein G7Y89_g12545 [Cudoniella acicularis]
MATASLYPLANKEELMKLFVGKSLKDVPTPAAVLDLSKLKSNCSRMLEAVDALKFGWRAHIKTHKTAELTRLQVGGGIGPVNIIVSTIIEAENVLPLLLEYKSAGRVVNVLYSFPITPSAVPGLALVSKTLASTIPSVFLKIDMGGHRAGIAPQTAACSTLISSLLALESQGHLHLLGLYSHAGHSYSSSNRASALDYLRQEFESLFVTSSAVHSISPSKPLVLSVGATPTTTSVRNLLVEDGEGVSEEEVKAIAALKATIEAIREEKCSIEIHAGVYPILDIQQLATHALPSTLLSYPNQALTILTEIASLYPSRGKPLSNSPTSPPTSEALLASGSLALGREPCKAYPGWGILSPWNRPGVIMPTCPPEEYRGWIGMGKERGKMWRRSWR